MTRIALSLLLLLSSPVLLWSQCERQLAVDDYNNNYLPSAFDVDDLNWTGNLETCAEGTVSSTVRNKILQRINYFRRLVGVEDQIVFSSSLNQKCQKAAHMQEKNASLSHCSGNNNAPCNNWDCNHPAAIEASQSSNLAWGTWNYFNPIDLYMEDAGQYNAPVGHRRWILHSQAKTFGNGITPNRQALWVFGNRSNPEVYEEFIAYPPASYIPQGLVYPRWSFGIPGASFTQANVSMQDEDGNNIALTIVHQANSGFGDRTIVWEPQGVETSSPYDKEYTVTISNVQNAAQSSYTYTTTIIPPVFPPNCPENTSWNSTTCACEGGGMMTISGEISSGTYTSAEEIMATGTIPPGEDVTFQSETQISLQAGFSAAAGSTFNAEIVDNVNNAATVEARQAPDSEGRAGVSEFAPLEANRPSVASNFTAPKVSVRPNPARQSTQWQLELPVGEMVSLYLFDPQGRLVKTLLDQQVLSAGTHVKDIALYDLPTGIYFLQTQTSQSKIVRRIVVLD